MGRPSVWKAVGQRESRGMRGAPATLDPLACKGQVVIIKDPVGLCGPFIMLKFH